MPTQIPFLDTMFETLNTRVAESAVGRWFRLDGSGHPKQREGSLFTVSAPLKFGSYALTDSVLD